MKKLGILVVVLVAAQFLPQYAKNAAAWELELVGAMNWTYEWYDQRGSNGFFGPYDVDRGAGTSSGNLNFWNGGQFDTNLVTGANASWSYFNVEMEPVITINEAVSLSGKYRIAHFGDAASANYHAEEAPGTDNAISAGQWTMFWASIETPWGSLVFGKRPWEFGTAFQYDGSDALTWESVLLVVPYGPFRFGLGFYPYRFAGDSPLGFGDPFDLQIPQYFSRADRSATLLKEFTGFMIYSDGPMETGVLASFGSYHVGPESALGANSLISLDSLYCHGSAYMKYNNGRFFFNSELAWLCWIDRYSDPNAVLGPPNPRYVEQLRYMLEGGFVAGPARISLLHAWSPGPDRRNGALIGKQSAAFVWHPTFDSHLGNFSVWSPYSYLLGYNYGSGLGAYNLSGDGYIVDACVFAGRLDYALAANLNISASFLWAERTSNGYGWGCIGPNDNAFNGVANDGNLALDINGAPGSPNIPDRALGYEVDFAMDWQLLEGWTATLVVAYWQPGKWFNYACVDRSVPGWNAPGPGNSYGTRPGKTIDPVMGGEFSMCVEF